MAKNGKGGNRPIVTFIVAVIGAIATVTAAWIAHRKSDEANQAKSAVRWVVRVFNSKRDGVPNARLAVAFNDGRHLEEHTDDWGAHIFALERALLNQPADLTVTADGYKDFHGQTFVSEVSPASVYLNGATAQVVVVPVVPTSTPMSSMAMPTSRTSTQLGPTLTPTPSPTITTTLSVIEKIFDSGPKPSGNGRDFSPPYRLCADPAPPGYVVAEAQFYLTGDRQCGAWSTCTDVTQPPGPVCWAFTLQGHDECLRLFNNCEAVRNSEGHLRLVYKPAHTP